MGRVFLQKETTERPITLIGEMAGICYDADTSDPDKNYKRGMDCLNSQHGRTWEFPEVYMILDGYSARVIREFYTHIGGAPTRLGASTRYINYGDFQYYIPPSIENNRHALDVYTNCMYQISEAAKFLSGYDDVPKEDIANLYPLGMKTKVVVKMNLRTLIDMSHQRMCNRAYHEFRALFSDITTELKRYSSEWETVATKMFMPKCKYLRHCPEKKSCGYYHG